MREPRTILIVEDDVPFAEFLRASFESLGHRTAVITDGSLALAAFLEHQPHIVFLDLLLPKRDGFKVCEDIRSAPQGAKVPIVMMTGIYKKALYEREGLEKAGASEYLYKPFGVREAWRALEQHLGQESSTGPRPESNPHATGVALDESALACQLQEHLRDRSDGVLFVRGPETTIVLYLRQGVPVFVRSNDAADRLDKVLARSGKVSPEALAAANRACTDTRGRVRLGEALLTAGALSREQLELQLQLQLRLILNRAFQLESGHCLFVAGEHPTEEDVLLQGNPRALLLRGARATPQGAARRHLPPADARLARIEGWEALLGDLHLKDDETRLLQLADGATTVERFLATSAVAGFDGHRILFALCSAGLVVELPPHGRAAPVAATLEWDAASWEQRPFGAAFADACRKRATGTLTVVTGGISKSLVLRAGCLVAVRSDAEGDRIGAMIARMQLVDPGPLAEALEATRGCDDVQLVHALVDRELLGATESYWAAVYRAHGAVHDLLALVPDALAWEPGPCGPEVIVLPDVPTPELAWNGIRALDDATVDALLPPETTRLAPSHDGEQSMVPLSPDEEAVLDAMRARPTLGALGAGDAEISASVRRTVLGLLWLGLAREMVPVRSEAEQDHPSFLPARTEAPASPATDGSAPTHELLALDASDEGAESVTSEASLDEPVPQARPVVKAAKPAVRVGPDFIDMLHDDGFLDDEEEEDMAIDESPTRRPSVSAAPASRHAPQPAGRMSAHEAAPVTDGIADLARRLRELRPVVRTLRSGMDGDDQRILVDRARMAELFDSLLDAIGTTCQIEELLARWREQVPPERVSVEEREPVGV